MQVVFTIDNAAALNTAMASLKALAPVWGEGGGETGETVAVAAAAKAGATAAPRGRGRPRKEVEVAPPLVDDDEDLAGEETAEDDGLGDDEEAAEPVLTLEHVIDVAKDYAKKHGREKAAKIIQRFNVKSIRDVKPSDFKLILKAFKA